MLEVIPIGFDIPKKSEDLINQGNFFYFFFIYFFFFIKLKRGMGTELYPATEDARITVYQIQNTLGQGILSVTRKLGIFPVIILGREVLPVT